MVNKVDIKYIIDGLGTYEETVLGGYEESSYFYLGNNKVIKVLIEKVLDDKVVLKFDKKSKLILPNMDNTVEMKKGEEITPFLPIKPSPNFKIIILDIREEQKLYYL